MNDDERNFRIDYIEFGSSDIERTKRFYTGVFGWVLPITAPITPVSKTGGYLAALQPT